VGQATTAAVLAAILGSPQPHRESVVVSPRLSPRIDRLIPSSAEQPAGITGPMLTCARGENPFYYCDPAPLRLGEQALSKEKQDELWRSLPSNLPHDLESTLRTHMGLQLVLGKVPGFDGNQRRVVILMQGEDLASSAGFLEAWATLAPQLEPRPGTDVKVSSRLAPFARLDEQPMSAATQRRFFAAIDEVQLPAWLRSRFHPDRINLVTANTSYWDSERNLFAFPENASAEQMRNEIKKAVLGLENNRPIQDETLPAFILANETRAQETWITKLKGEFLAKLDASSVMSAQLSALPILEGDQSMLEMRGDQMVLVLRRDQTDDTKKQELRDFLRAFLIQKGREGAAVRRQNHREYVDNDDSGRPTKNS
jgi:hypothetical protein